MLDTAIDVAFYIVPLLIGALASFIARNKSWLAHCIIWVLVVPVLLVFGPTIVALVGLHVFGVDLFD